MRARIVDPRGPLWIRCLTPAAGAAICLAALLPSLALGLTATTFLTGLAVLFLAPFLPSRFLPRDAELRLGAGYVDVRRAGVLTQRLRGRRIVGASTARAGNGYALGLMRRRGGPLFVEVATLADADRLRAALGIGHHGFGALFWQTRPDPVDRIRRVARILGAAGALLTAFGISYGGQGSFSPGPAMFAFLLGLIALTITTVLGISALLARSGMGPPPTLYLEPRGLVLNCPYTPAPWSVIHAAEDRGDRFHIDLRAGGALGVPMVDWGYGPLTGLTVAERAHVIALINAAVQRARGRCPPPREIAAQIEALAEDPRDARAWLDRLDAAAHHLRDGGVYRGSALTEEDLWHALEDHDAAPPVRTAAARLLIRAGGDSDRRLRIERIAASARDRKVERRIRIALEEDPDTAAARLEALAEEESGPETVRRRPAAR